jgi:hypothetical protein
MFGPLFSTVQIMRPLILIKKFFGLHLGQFFSQTHLVTLPPGHLHFTPIMRLALSVIKFLPL